MKFGKTHRKTPPVLGLDAKAPRPTLIGALWLFLVMAVPVFAVLSLLEALLRWVL